MNFYTNNNSISDIDLALNEIFSGFHPNITQKELCILKEILWTIHDIGDGMYEQVIIRLLKDEKDLFENREEVEDLVIDLCKKEIIQKRIGFAKYYGGCLCDCFCCSRATFRPEKSLSLQKNVEHEALDAISDIF
jgi:hypothetical protein